MMFYKMEGNGNDFVVIENLDNSVSEPEKGFTAKRLCDRRFGVGADGIILIENSVLADFRMRLFNADGSEAEMCGNGARCMARFCRDVIGFDKDKISIETGAGIIDVWFEGKDIRLRFGEVNYIGNPLEDMDGDFLVVGVPHYVVEVSSVDDVDVDNLGRRLRYRKEFPEGANIDFVEVVSRDSIRVRTYERGVEAETPSCGTGASASAYAMYVRGKTGFPLTVFNRGGRLKIDVDMEKNGARNLFLIGNARFVFKGEWIDD